MLPATDGNRLRAKSVSKRAPGMMEPMTPCEHVFVPAGLDPADERVCARCTLPMSEASGTLTP